MEGCSGNPVRTGKLKEAEGLTRAPYNATVNRGSTALLFE